ncbi:TRAP-type C4-dicarboxylate transport system permease small subunit [Aliiruegeria haliotis]|uniref:TRAP transporter small permease protein n=1 Tax=Aliiruegeria haliotis TaxID=1280846 RepID=A0A2T0RMV3_9RHOB|nr:TRAP transporter small permease [Aliiruegeria haliotis]PRY22471.1 TRAP-type C4-dicarboxylate transport system permease small subunit [Aliiruegeria haliotis]
MIRSAFRYVLAAHLAVLCVLVAYQVVARYVEFIPPFLWTEEFARLVFMWMVMIGAGYGFIQQTHFSFTFLKSAMPPRLGRYLSIVILLASLAVMSFFAWSSWIFFMKGFGRTSLVTGLPMATSYGALLFGGLISVCAIAVSLFGVVFRSGASDEQEG